MTVVWSSDPKPHTGRYAVYAAAKGWGEPEFELLCRHRWKWQAISCARFYTIDMGYHAKVVDTYTQLGNKSVAGGS